ncbi:PilN domain-containing protein [Gluconacetobacter tumulisoli]|uniref:PilN domain-containing protein n=1 Tax=Gluconacetobacter tumulisoli TaxID=1286189 RepID=A0A7W4K953_9PROT|nr:PilN domain-containing protein [Gluconacetobacter tumulisoli]MBB2202577.1 PilN domain-containing protein [Gluconacetobacter tumulisoli]
MIAGDLFIWWRRQIGDMIPARWRLSRFSAKPVVVAVIEGPRLVVSLIRQGVRTPVGVCGLSSDEGAGDGDVAACRRALSGMMGTGAPASIVLRLPPGMLMQRDVVLPSAAEGNLDAVLNYEMDRLTPFPADAIWYAYDILHRDPERRQLHMRLSIVPKASIASALAALARVGLRPDMLEDAGSQTCIPMSEVRNGHGRRTRMAIAAAAVLLPVIGVTTAFWRQSVEQDHLTARIAMLRPSADEARTLRRQAEDRSAGAGMIAQERRRLGDPMEVLATVTRILPDDSFLTDLILRQGQLIISGQSSAATGLIQALSTNPLFRSPAFVAPVTRVEGQNASLFSIHAGVGH